MLSVIDKTFITKVINSVLLKPKNSLCNASIVAAIKTTTTKFTTQPDRPDSPIGDYGQFVPGKEYSYHGVKHTAPPILPPHLLQVILNKEVPLHVSCSS